MSEQLGFPGLGRDAACSHRLFFALLPQPPDASRIFRLGERLRAASGLQGMPVAADRLHVSLHGFGDHSSLPERLVGAARRAGDALVAPQFEIAFDCAGSFRGNGGVGGKRPFVLRPLHEDDALSLFHRALANAMTRTGLRRWIAFNFTPHMTLLYDRRIAPQRAIETVRFPVCELLLVHSLLPQGRYVPLARWPLRG